MSAATSYQDIIHLSRPFSNHPKMAIANRAKLFTPFAALRGFDIELLTQEQDRLLVPQVRLSNDQREIIWRALNEMQKGDWVTVTYFQPVKSLNGQPVGEYTLSTGVVKKVDDVEQLLELENMSAPFGNIHSLVVQGLEGADSA